MATNKCCFDESSTAKGLRCLWGRGGEVILFAQRALCNVHIFVIFRWASTTAVTVGKSIEICMHRILMTQFNWVKKSDGPSLQTTDCSRPHSNGDESYWEFWESSTFITRPPTCTWLRGSLASGHRHQYKQFLVVEWRLHKWWVRDYIEIATDDLPRVLFWQNSNTELLSPNTTEQVGEAVFIL